MNKMTGRENYNDLHVFMLVAREGSFTRAAARLGLAQSGISRTIRDLEAQLGVQLLVRTGGVWHERGVIWDEVEEAWAWQDRPTDLRPHWRS